MFTQRIHPLSFSSFLMSLNKTDIFTRGPNILLRLGFVCLIISGVTVSDFF